MDKIKQWTLTISAVSIISGIIYAVLPRDTNKNFFKAIVSIIIIYTALQPLIGTKSIDFRISDYLKDNYQVSESIDKYALSAMINSAEKAIEDLLAEKSQVLEMSVDFRCRCYEENNEIMVEEISVSSETGEYDYEKIENLIESLGFDKGVIVYEGESNEHR